MIYVGIGIALAFAAGVLAGFKIGHVSGGRNLWARMLADRKLGNQALERLATEHGAKLEIDDV
jgi:hypothetical protein